MRLSILSIRTCQCGSLTLEATITIAFGMVGALLFSNLTGYVSARGGVEQSAIRVARCVTPTDASCHTVSAEPISVEGSWWGRRASAVHFAPQVDYDLSFTARTTHFQVTPYAIELVRPEIAWRTAELATYRYRQALNVGENIWGTVTVPASLQWYVQRGVFPQFAVDYNADPDSWALANSSSGETTWQRTYALIDPSVGDTAANRVYNHGPLRISPNDAAQFVSNWIPTPAPITDGMPCADNNDANCSAALAAGDSEGATGDWARYVYVAVKAFARVHADGGSAEVSWRQARGGSDAATGAGLVLVVQEADGSQSHRALGCRDWYDLSAGAEWHNLWVRGPAGANGDTPPGDGTPTVRSGACGNNDYDVIKIPRGAKFQFVGNLSAQGGAVNAEVVYLYHFSDVVKQTAATVVQCPDVRYSFRDKKPLCPAALSGCGANVPANAVPTDSNWCTASSFSKTATTPVCDEASFDAHSKRIGGAAAVEQIQVAACDAVAPTQLAAPSGRFLCKVPEKTLLEEQEVVLARDASCPGAVRVKTGTAYCEQQFAPGSAYTVAECLGGQGVQYRNLLEREREGGESDAAVRERLPLWFTGRVQDGGTAIALESRYQGETVEATPEATMDIAVTDVALDRAGVINYQRQTPCDFREAIISALAARYPTAEVSVTCAAVEQLAKSEEVRSEFAEGYPFDRAVDALYDGDGSSAVYDPRTDRCTVQSVCSSAAQPRSLDAQLLSFARQSTPLLAELPSELAPHISVTATQVGLRPVAVAEFAALRSACTPLSCYPQYSAAELVAASGSEPRACEDGTFADCYFEAAAVYEAPEVSAELLSIDQSRLWQLAQRELSAVYPLAKVATPCGESKQPNCLDLSVAIDDATSMAAITVEYHYPTSFPMREMLGEDAVTLSYSLREPVELLIAR